MYIHTYIHTYIYTHILYTYIIHVYTRIYNYINIGISHQELRFVIQEADDNENGVVEFEEFVPLAVDLIQSYRALNRAKIFCSQRDSLFEEEVQQKLKELDFDRMSRYV